MSDKDAIDVVTNALHDNRSALRAYVTKRADRNDVDDVLQIAAMNALERAPSLRDPERVLGWLLRIHANTITDLGRKASRDQKLLNAWSVEPQEVSPVEAETCGCSLSHAKELNPNYASIIDLVDIVGLPLTKAAAKLNISVNNATVRLHRARAALKQRLEEHCGVTTIRGCNDCNCTSEGC